MQINLQEIVPDYIDKKNINGSQVWGKKITY